MKLPPPLEDEDCIALVQWMELRKLRFSHVPHETFTRSPKVKRKNWQKGVRAGVPDYIIVIPGRIVIFLEMKRAKPGKSEVSKDQRAWIADLEATPGVAAHICYGYDEAVETIESYLT